MKAVYKACAASHSEQKVKKVQKIEAEILSGCQTHFDWVKQRLDTCVYEPGKKDWCLKGTIDNYMNLFGVLME